GMGALFAVTAYPKAKLELQEVGYSPAQIKAMPISQAILTAEVEMFDRLRDSTFKWFSADYVSALQGFADTDRQLGGPGKSKQEIIPLASLMLPALSKVKWIEVKTDREVAALRTVEAIRWYAAQNDGWLPEKLNDLTGAPIPLDPLTEKPFAYELRHDVG